MKLVGMPDDQLEGFRKSPTWGMFEGVAHTLAYDAAVVGDEADVPVEKAARVTVPALVMAGSATYPFMLTSAETLAKAMPHAQYRILEGQTHEVNPEALAPVLDEFFMSRVGIQ